MRTVALTGEYRRSDDSPANVLLRFTPTSVLKSVTENIVVLNQPILAMTSGAGEVSVTLYPMQPGLTPAQFLYLVEEIEDGQTIDSWYLRLNTDTPDAITIVGVRPSAPPEFIDLYPTLDEVRAISSDLDQPIYTAMGVAQEETRILGLQLEAKIGTEDIGNTVAGLTDGLIRTENLPTIRFADSFSAGSQVAMLVDGSPYGTVCARYDLGISYVLLAADSTVLSNWVALSSNFSVDSVNGQAGIVNLNYVDVGAAAVDHGHDVMSGYEYRATFMTADVLSITDRLVIGEGGDTLEFTDHAITRLDSAGNVVYTISPYTVMPWVSVPMLAYSISSSTVLTATVTATVRQTAQDSADVRIVATGINTPCYFMSSDVNFNGALNDLVLGVWVSTDASGVVLDDGVVHQIATKITPRGWDAHTTDSISVKGTILSAFVPDIVEPPPSTLSSIIDDVDGVPYLDFTGIGEVVLADTDGVPYYVVGGSTGGDELLADTDGVPYFG